MEVSQVSEEFAPGWSISYYSSHTNISSDFHQGNSQSKAIKKTNLSSLKQTYSYHVFWTKGLTLKAGFLPYENPQTLDWVTFCISKKGSLRRKEVTHMHVLKHLNLVPGTLLLRSPNIYLFFSFIFFSIAHQSYLF